MRRIRLISSFLVSTIVNHPNLYVYTSFTEPTIRHSHRGVSIISASLSSLSSSLKSLRFSHSASPHSDHAALNDPETNSDDEMGNDDHDTDTNLKQLSSKQGEGFGPDVEALVRILCDEPSRLEMKSKLEQCEIEASLELVNQVLSRVRNDWEAAYTFFLWVGKQPGYAHSLREYHSMISILGKMKKFDTAWALIDEMRMMSSSSNYSGSSLVTSQTLLIMIRRYCAVHDVGKAINTFYAFKRFNLVVGIDDFDGLLSALCRYKNVEDAEQLLFCNENVFPLNIKSFNIILNGWCNVIVSVRDAQRVWREMSMRGIEHDVFSYASMLSCYSKACNLKSVIKLFNHMKQAKVEPDRKAYNAVIFALARGRLFKEAINIVRTMEEKGIVPNVVTYNSLIKPLCKAQKIDEAREIFDDMLQQGLSPTVQTYHAFFHILSSAEEVFVHLDKMKNKGCNPNTDTYTMLIRKFCRWRQLDNVFKLWNEMNNGGGSPDRSSYVVLIHGLFLNGKLEEAYKYYKEMKEKQYMPEPWTEDIIQAWLSGKEVTDLQMADMEHNLSDYSEPYKTRMVLAKVGLQKDLCKPEIKERGFSFWKQ